MKNLRPERARKFAARFVQNGFNPVQAVIDCGITKNRNSAHVIGYRLLRNVTTQRHLKLHMEKAKMDADEVLEKLSQIARTSAEFKGSDVVKANELLGKAHKLWSDRVEVSEDSGDEKRFISSVISRTAKRVGISEFDAELSIQRIFSDESAEDYDPAIDPRKNPNRWPSGNLLAVREIEAESESVS